MKATILTATTPHSPDTITIYVTGCHYTKRRQVALLLGSTLLDITGDGSRVTQEEGEVTEQGERRTPEPRRRSRPR